MRFDEGTHVLWATAGKQIPAQIVCVDNGDPAKMPYQIITEERGEAFWVTPGELGYMYPKAPRIIGVTGYKRSGKDSFCRALRGFGYKQVAFAEPMKQMVVFLLRYQGVDEDTINRMLDGDLKEQPSKYLGGRSMRYALQTIGTEWGRDLMALPFWRDIAMNVIDAAPERRFIVSDVRFVNEAELIHEKGGIVVRVTRPGTGAGDLHPSETEIAKVPEDYTIPNDGGRADFAFRAATFYNEVISQR